MSASPSYYWKTLNEIWRVFVVVAIFAVISLGTVTGWGTQVGFLTFTLFGAYAVLRKPIQIWLAEQQVRSTRQISWEKIIQVSKELYPQHSAQFDKLLKKGGKFDVMRAKWARIIDPESRSDWFKPANISEEHDVVRLWFEVVAESWKRTTRKLPTMCYAVPYFRTKDVEMVRLIQSILTQTYPGAIRVIIVMNEIDPVKKAWLEDLVAPYKSGQITFLVRVKTKGKRNAMNAAFKRFVRFYWNKLDEVFIGNIDSDSEIDVDATSNMLRMFLALPNIHCITGDIRVFNDTVNLLTWLTAMRYWKAFLVERTSQAYERFFGTTCMSGPLMVVRGTTMALIRQRWANQIWRGKRQEFGDDRHIATLVLMLFHRGSSICVDAIAYTDVPESLWTWIIQQVRWAKSAWRETIVLLPVLPKLPLYIISELAYLTLYPFILTFILVTLLARAAGIYVDGGLEPALLSLLPYVIVTFGLSFLFDGVYGALKNRDVRYLIYPLYNVMHFMFLQPIRFYALATIDNTGWGTRQTPLPTLLTD